MFLFLSSLVACMAPDALSDDEDVLPGPGHDTDAADTESRGETGNPASSALGVSGWTVEALPTDAVASDGRLRATRMSPGSVLCQHTGLVAACGELLNAGATPSEDGATVAYTVASGTDGGRCAYTVSYVVDGMPDTEGAITVSLSVDGTDATTLDVRGTYDGWRYPIE